MTHISPRWSRVTFTVLIAISLLVASLTGCADTPTPTPPPPTATRTATATIIPPTDTPEPTATATSTPLPPHAPFITYRFPAPGEELRTDAPIAITFDQPMDQASVEAAFQIQPAVKGELKWQDNTLTFKPTGESFLRNATYTVSINERAKSLMGLPIQAPAAFRLRTVGYLEATDVQPADDTVEVDMKAAVTVSFNRPVVPLTSIGSQASLPQPLRFTPPVEGQGEWLNTSIYTFRPSSGFLPATTYEVRIAAGLEDTTGGALPEDFAWSFTTKLPAVSSTEPFDGANYIAPTTPITVTFNQPMDQASAQAAFSLADSRGQAVPGSFTWAGGAMRFTPAAPLAMGASYRGQVNAGALALGSERGTETAFGWSFQVIAQPRIVSTSPADGDAQASPYTELNVTFSGPMDPATLRENLTIIPEPTEIYSGWARSNTRLWLSFGAKASTSYKVTLGAGLAGRYGHTLGQPQTISFTTRAMDPSVYLSSAARVGTYSAYSDAVVGISHLNVSSMTLLLFRLSEQDFVRLNSNEWWQAWQDFSPAPSALLRQWSLDAAAPLNERVSKKVAVEAQEGVRLAPGLYYLLVTGTGVQDKQAHIMVVGRTNLVVKHSEQEMLVWATDLSTGQPVPDLPLTIQGEKVNIQGTTDKDGVFKTPLEKHDPWLSLFVFARRGQETTVAVSTWSSGIDHWEFGLNSGWEQPYRGIVYTERPIYRPGQKVYFKGILRTDDDGRYGLPALETIQMRIIDSQGNEVYRDALTLSDMGTFSGEFTLGDEAALGIYYLEASGPEDLDPGFYVGANFQVAEYRKPEYLVNVTTDQESYIQGDEIAVNVEASYFFGGALRDAPVQWRLMSQNHTFLWEGKGWWDFTDMGIEDWQRPWSAYGEFVTEGKGRTDPEGRFTFALPADIAARKMSQVFTIEATVTDVNGQEVSARASAIVHKGLFYIGLQPQAYIGAAGQEQKVNVITVDTEGITVTQVALEMSFYQVRWYSVQEKDADGSLRWTFKSEDTLVGTQKVTTDDKGKAVASFVPEKGGTYRIRAVGADQRGNQVSSSTYMWVSSSEYTAWRQENHNRIELVPDQKSYAPGDTAHILIPSPYQGETKALLTIERGRILEHRILTLASNSEQVAIPITADHAPNIFVSVFIVKGQDADNPLPSFRLGYATLPVSPREKELTITITPDRDTYGPGETAKYRIQATDYAGRGVEAEASLALIDLSVLTLSADQGPDLMQTFYAERGLSIRTGSTLALASQEVAAAPQSEELKAKGGGGGESGGLDVRQDFPDTAYWNPALRTDAQGAGQVEVKLADSLTTWRMRAQVVTADTAVGKAQVDVVSTKDLLIRPVTPRFFVVGDKAQLAAVIHNNTPAEFQAQVKLEATGLKVQGAAQMVNLPGNGIVKVTWEVEALPGDQADLVFSVTGGGLSDAAKPSFGVLPVYRYSTPEVVGTSGQVEPDETRVEVVQLPVEMDPTQGELLLKLEPSLAAGMRDGLTYLKTYPYDCIEQTVSRFLPNVVTYRALRNLGIRNTELEAALPEEVSKSLQRLYVQQHYDGGWGWWVSDESNAFLTAYVVLGLNEAQRASLAVDGEVMSRAVAFLEEGLSQALDVKQGHRANERAFVLYVLAEYYADHDGAADLGRAVALYERRDTLDIYGKAYLAMALQLMAPGESSRFNTLLSDINSAAIRSATATHWEEQEIDYRTMNTDLRSTAIVLRALVRLAPENPMIPNTVRWLMSARKAGYWPTTQETAWSIMALTDYMAASGELEADYSYRIGLNGQVWGDGAVSADTLDEPRQLRAEVGELLTEVGNQIWLEREAVAGQTGKGKLYYTAHLRYFLPVQDLEALNRGIIISRQYSQYEDPKLPVEQAKVGDIIQVKLTIIAPNDLHYLVVEDPLPAGCEAVDTSLQTSSVAYEEGKFDPIDWDKLPYWWYFKHSELRDEKVALFATSLGRGTYEYTYLMRASLPGEFLVMPTQAYEMYFPEVFGRSDGGMLVIAEE